MDGREIESDQTRSQSRFFHPDFPWSMRDLLETYDPLCARVKTYSPGVGETKQPVALFRFPVSSGETRSGNLLVPPWVIPFLGHHSRVESVVLLDVVVELVVVH